jgi:hypothetical protein
MNRTRVMLMTCLVICLQGTTRSQKPNRAGHLEQASFGAEEVPFKPLVKRPVPLPDLVLQILKVDDGVKSCLEYNPLAPDQLLSSWFIGSEIHLGGPHETDLVVLPSPRGEQSVCFHSAEGIGWFWVFRQASRNYQLVLQASGNGLDILKTRTNAYRDIQAVTATRAGGLLTTITFQFDGRRYRESRKNTHALP